MRLLRLLFLAAILPVLTDSSAYESEYANGSGSEPESEIPDGQALITPKRKRGRKQINPARRYFKVMNITEANGKLLVKSLCQVYGCSHVMKGDKSCNMMRHLKDKHPAIHKVAEAAEVVDAGKEDDEDKMISIVVKISVKSLKAALVEIITINGRPFAYMEDSGLQKIIRPYMEGLPPNLRFAVSAESMKNYITETANALIEDLKKELKGKKPCLKVDAVSRLHRSFLGINVQFIVKDKIVIRTLSVTELLVRHTGVNLKQIVLDTLEKYDINLKDVYTVTSDNGSNMLKAGELLKEMQIEELVSETDISLENASEFGDPTADPFLFTEFEVNQGQPSERSMFVIPCAAHILQLVVEAFMKLEEIKILLAKVRKIMNFLRNQNNLLLLRKRRFPLPVLDVATRWHSAVDMLISFLNLKPICTELKVDFTEEDWAATEALIKCLEPLKIATKVFESEQLLMGDFYGEWILCKETLEQLKNSEVVDEELPLFKRLVNRQTTLYADLLLEAMEKRESEPNQAFTREGITLLNNPAVVASVYLDPRFFPMLSEEAKDTAERVLKDLHRELNGEDAANAKDAADKAPTPKKPVDPNSKRNILREKILEKNRQRNIVPLSNDRNVIDEQLLSYRNSVELIEDLDTNILEWWTDIGILKWPELYPLTRIVHAAPATQVTVERLFSQFKFVFSALRNNMKSDRAEEIMLIRANALFKAKELQRCGEYSLASKILKEAEALENSILKASESSPSSGTESNCSTPRSA